MLNSQMHAPADVVIVNCGLGNVGSIQNMLKRIGAQVRLSASPEEIRQAPRLILPGVGSFDAGMERLKKARLTELLTEVVVHRRVPTLGICLGMQLMTHGSEEGKCVGLSWVKADTRRFRFDGSEGPRLKVPHMGWNTVSARRATALLETKAKARFYFVHSYYVCCKDECDVLATTPYGHEFTSMFSVENIVGVQFHPEKSHQFGLALFQNWLKTTAPALGH